MTKVEVVDTWKGAMDIQVVVLMVRVATRVFAKVLKEGNDKEMT